MVAKRRVRAARSGQGRQAYLTRARNEDDKRRVVLEELQSLTRKGELRNATLLGRFLQCQELQLASALFAKAVEHCSRWHAGKHLLPPSGTLPPASSSPHRVKLYRPPWRRFQSNNVLPPMTPN